MTHRCKKCGSYDLIPTPESNYQDLKCARCKEVFKVRYENKPMSDGNWGHGIG